ncbi:hypothetical protein P3S68_011808 [Capsicum galapagoense]
MVFGRGNGRSSGAWPDLPWLYTDLWIKRSKIFKNINEVAQEDHNPLPDDLCFLQFTSGSTSDPKGVVITHRGIIHNVELMQRRYQGQHKDDISELATTSNKGNNSQKVHRVDLNLSGLSREVIAPGYGLAENCVYVNSAYGEGLPILVDWQGKVCCGYANVHTADAEIKIFEPDTGKEYDDSTKEGEIWISSLSAEAGYWGMEKLSRKTFENELLTEPRKRYIRTGDLGRIIDGKLFITGRIKDLIIDAGRNIYSTDVEKTIEKIFDLLRPGCCAVVGIPDEILMSKGISFAFPICSDQLGLVVVAEAYNLLPYEVIECISTRVAEEQWYIYCFHYGYQT